MAYQNISGCHNNSPTCARTAHPGLASAEALTKPCKRRFERVAFRAAQPWCNHQGVTSMDHQQHSSGASRHYGATTMLYIRLFGLYRI